MTNGEYTVFSKYVNANGYWAGLVKGVAMNRTITARNAAADMPYNIPVLPAFYDLSPLGSVDGVW